MSFFKQLLVLIILASAGYWGWQQYVAMDVEAKPAAGKSRRSRAAPVVETAKAEMREIETLIDAVGSTRARRAVEITPLAPGRVTQINIQAGKVVKQGALLMRLDDDIQRADLVEARAQLSEARSALTRARSLKRTSAVAEETVDRLVLSVATAQANHDRTARRLQDRTISAPFAGTVGFSRVELGARIEDGDVVTTLDDLSAVEIEFSLPEGRFGQVRPGQSIIAFGTAFPGQQFAGSIESIDSRIDPVGRSFKARAVVANPGSLLPAGMFMHISVVLNARRVLSVLEESIVVDGDRAFVFTVAKGDKGLRAKREQVTLGQRSFGYVEIVSGIEQDNDVVIRGVQRVRDGSAVQRAGDANEQKGEKGKKGDKGKRDKKAQS